VTTLQALLVDARRDDRRIWEDRHAVDDEDGIDDNDDGGVSEAAATATIVHGRKLVLRANAIRFS